MAVFEGDWDYSQSIENRIAKGPSRVHVSGDVPEIDKVEATATDGNRISPRHIVLPGTRQAVMDAVKATDGFQNGLDGYMFNEWMKGNQHGDE